MKKLLLFSLIILALMPVAGFTQNSGRPDVFQKANNAVNKVSNAIAVFQPYLLKARQLFYDAKQMASDVKSSSNAVFGKNGNANNTGVNGGSYSNNGQYSNGYDTSHNNQYNNQYSNSANNNTYATSTNNGYNNQSANSSSTYSTNGTSGAYQNNMNGYNQSPQNYLPNQNLPVNNPATINNDGTGNWGNQNNGLYGNCLDALTGTVMGMGDAAQAPASVDLMFFAPADGQNTYHIMTPGFARNNGTAGYMTEHVSEQVMQWSDVNETEVALTKLTISQFNQIQNNGQIQSAVRNAQNYSGNYSSVGEKLDGQVLAVKAQMDNREVYALIAVVKQIGTSGNNGYLKIKIKSTGLDSGNGQINASAYLR
ncbi:MAG: hypothetical protein JST75_02320 [Bacteroidetes bacterium]|nr:hypothetical protein [Bacteroidota bacterium]